MADPNGHDAVILTGKFDLVCNSCKQIMRLTPQSPRVIFVGATYCPYCGAQNISQRSVTTTYFQSLGTDLGLPDNKEGAELTRALFELWEPTAGDPILFMDFARRMIKEA